MIRALKSISRAPAFSARDDAAAMQYLVPGWQPEGLLQLLSTEYKFAVSFVILIVVLLFRPTGLFRGKSF